MTSVRHDDITRFTSRGRQRHSKRSIRRCRLRGRKPRTLRGLGNGYQVRPELVTRAECIKVSWGAGIPKCTVTHVTHHPPYSHHPSSTLLTSPMSSITHPTHITRHPLPTHLTSPVSPITNHTHITHHPPYSHHPYHPSPTLLTSPITYPTHFAHVNHHPPCPSSPRIQDS